MKHSLGVFSAASKIKGSSWIASAARDDSKFPTIKISSKAPVHNPPTPHRSYRFKSCTATEIFRRPQIKIIVRRLASKDP